jgi:RNA polymerase sigma-70 factor (ECF subfamily)
MEEASDAELLRASARDPDAFGALFDRHASALLAYFYRRTGCAETAADLTMETFAQAFAHRRRYRETGAGPRAWLFGIAGHQLGRLARRQRVSTRYRARMGIEESTTVDADDIARIEAMVDWAPVREAVAVAVAALPPGEAAALKLRIGDDLPYAEVAARLQCSEPAARMRVMRALGRLQTALEVP